MSCLPKRRKRTLFYSEHVWFAQLKEPKSQKTETYARPIPSCTEQYFTDSQSPPKKTKDTEKDVSTPLE